MIRSFADKDTERLSSGFRVARFVAFERVALRKIRQLQSQTSCLTSEYRREIVSRR